MAVTLNTRALKSRESTSDPWVNTVIRANTSLAPVLAITGDGDLSADFAAGDLTEAANELKGETNLALDSIGIVVDGNTAAVNISAGQYVILKNSTITGRDDGLYIAANAVSAGNAVTAADLPGDPNNTGHPLPAGGLNDLRNTFKWTYINDITGTTNPLNLPASWEELYVEFWFQANPESAFSLIICKKQIYDRKLTAVGNSGTQWVQVYINATSNQISMVNASSVGIGNFRMGVWYR